MPYHVSPYYHLVLLLLRLELQLGFDMRQILHHHHEQVQGILSQVLVQ